MPSSRYFLKLFLCWLLTGLSNQALTQNLTPKIIQVGVIFSQSGTMAVNEQPLLNATLLAIDEVNQNNLLLHSRQPFKLQPVVVDGASSPQEFARQATELVDRRGIRIIFGCWSSDTRKAVLKVLEPRGALLYYPVHFEGQEISSSAIYSGLTANQQLFPALHYLSNETPPKIYLLGSDYLYQHVINKLCHQYLSGKGGRVVGEHYCPPDWKDFTAIVAEIKNSKCTAVLNTLNGESQKAFFSQYKQSQASATIMSLSLSESQAATLGDLTDGHLACWGYFTSLKSPQNIRFRNTFQKRFGSTQVVDEPCATAYTQVMTFARALVICGQVEPQALRKATRSLVLNSPAGLIRYDPMNLYCWRAVRIGRFLAGKAEIIWSSELPLRPIPFPRVSQ